MANGYIEKRAVNNEWLKRTPTMLWEEASLTLDYA